MADTTVLTAACRPVADDIVRGYSSGYMVDVDEPIG